jgi:hypothetical protein
VKAVLIVAAALLGASAVFLAIGRLWWIYSAVALPAAVLCYAIISASLHLQLAAQILIIAEVIALGVVWPSFATIAALVVLPAIVSAVVHFIQGTAARVGQAYVSLSTLLASAFLLWEAIILSHPRGESNDPAETSALQGNPSATPKGPEERRESRELSEKSSPHE